MFSNVSYILFINEHILIDLGMVSNLNKLTSPSQGGGGGTVGIVGSKK